VARAAAIRVQLATQEDDIFLSQLIEKMASKNGWCQNKHTVARSPLRITGQGLVALYTNNRTGSSIEAKRNLYLGFYPREGDVTLHIYQ
jgi:hypothetical protein